MSQTGNYTLPRLTAEYLLDKYPELNNLQEAEAYRIFCEQKNIVWQGGELGRGTTMWKDWEKQKAL